MKILYLAHRVPYPPNKGDKIRTFNEIKYLSRSHDIYLVCMADTPDDLKYKKNLEDYCRQVAVFPLNINKAKLNSIFALLTEKPLSVSYFYLNSLQKTVDHWIKKYDFDVTICFCSVMAEYIFKSKAIDISKKSSRPVLVMDFCDIDSQKWGQYAKKSKFPLSRVYETENNRLLEYEKYINKVFHHSIVVSEPEKKLFLSLFPDGKNIEAITNGVDFDYFSPHIPCNNFSGTQKISGPVLVFTGAMDYYANIEGVRWFTKSILPRVKKKLPGTLFYIVGNNPSSEVKELEKINGVKVTGFVDDIRPYYQWADICVVPLQIAVGIQNKILEAMSMGKPVVTTSKALEGIPAVHDKQVMVEDCALNFSETIINLINDSKKRRCLGINARTFVKNKFNWKTNVNSFEQFFIAGSIK